MSGLSVPFRGILAVGNTKTEAINRYRLLALGKGVSMFTDESQSAAFISNSSSGALAELFNPLTGDMDIVQANNLLEGLDFESQSSDVEVNHYECTSGCGAHLVYDDETLVQHCPVCASAVEASDEEESDDETEDDETAAPVDSGDDEEEESEDEGDDEAEAEDEEESEDEGDDEEEESEDEGEEESDEDESDESDEDEPLVVAADSLEEAAKIYAANKAQNPGISTSSDHEVHYHVCSSIECRAHVLSDEEITECPACSCDLDEPDEEDEESVSSGFQLSFSSDEVEDVEDVEDEGDDEEADEDEEDLDTEITDEGDDEDEEVESEDDEEEASLSGDDVEDDEESEEDDEVSDEDLAADDDLEDELDDEDEETTEVDVNPVDAVEESESAHQDLDVAYCGTLKGGAKWLAIYKGQPIASISRDQAGTNRDIFDSPTFGQVVHASAKHAGVRATLNDLGFKPFIQTISISSIVDSLSAERISEAQEALASDQEQYAESLQAALATAAVGLNRGFFVGAKNPLKDAFHSALSSAGIRNPEVLIANVFRDNADQFLKVLFAKANEIMEKPADVQTSLAKTVLETSYSESISNNGVSKVDESLGNMGTVVASDKKAIQVSESNDKSTSAEIISIQKVVSGLGRRRF